MPQKFYEKTGLFFKELRKEKGLTQEQLAQHLNTTGRTISRWETGNNMPDVDILIEMADFYCVDVRELMDGERKSAHMEKMTEETVLKVAEYSNEEKNNLAKRLHRLALSGVLSLFVYWIIRRLVSSTTGTIHHFLSFCSGCLFGFSLGLLIFAALYTSRYIEKYNSFKQRILRRE